MKETIAIVGSGNMGQAIAQGLLGKTIIQQGQLILTNSKTKNNKYAVQKADVIILAVKPQVVQDVLKEITEVVKGKLIISIIAGVAIDTLQESFGEKTAIVRVMPNLAARVGKSMSVWIKNKEVTKKQAEVVKKILEAIGTQLELQEEKQINMATAISGSGPAYFFYITELIEKGAQELGFSHKDARLLAKQTMLGSAELLQMSSCSAEELRHAVTSKGGTTEAAFREFYKRGFGRLSTRFHEGVLAAYRQAEKGLSK